MYTEDFNNGTPASGGDMTAINPGFPELNRAVDSLATGLSSLTENVSFYWEGKAAANYPQILSDSFDLTLLRELIHKLDSEITLAKSMLEL